MKVKKYLRRELFTVTAVQWDGDNFEDVADFMNIDKFSLTASMNNQILKVDIMRVPVGDYIVYDSEYNTYRHWEKENFEKEYKLVVDESHDEFYDKVFKCNDSELTRRDLESFPAPFCTENVSDETMQKIINETDAGTRQTWKLRSDEPLKNSDTATDELIETRNEKIDETWWHELEEAAIRYNVPYYEDLEDDETSEKQEYDIATFFIFKGVFTIKATSEQEARKLVEEQCGLVLGGGIHSTIDDEDVDWEFDMHPEQVIKSIKKK